MSKFDTFLKETCGFEFVKKNLCFSAGGDNSRGQSFLTDKGTIFVKTNPKIGALNVFHGEYESLKAIQTTGKIRVPRPISYMENGSGGGVMVMEYLEMKCLYSAPFAKLGAKLAELHLHNINLENSNPAAYESRFGFHMPTCCGFLPQDNEWMPDWTAFYERKLEEQMRRINDEYDDDEVENLWQKLKTKIPSFLDGITVKPSLLHGDLWCGNTSQTDDGEPVIYDPASFYGHHEYDLAIAGMFGGFSSSFYDAYHQHIPKAPGFDKRHQLYKLFHYLNHWNHFGDEYRFQSISIMKNLLQ